MNPYDATLTLQAIGHMLGWHPTTQMRSDMALTYICQFASCLVIRFRGSYAEHECPACHQKGMRLDMLGKD